MASAAQIKALLKSHADGDDPQFYAVALQVAAAAARSGHSDLAKELRDIVEKIKNRESRHTAQQNLLHIAQPQGEVADLLAIRQPSRKLLADRAYDANSLRSWLVERGAEPVIPPNPTRKNPHTYDRNAYRARNLIERMFCRLKDFRRIATRYDKRADIFLSAVCIAAAITWWTN